MSKSAIPFVASMQKIVAPGAGKDGYTQPAYVRSKRVIHISPKLAKVKAEFAKVAHACKGAGGRLEMQSCVKKGMKGFKA